MSDIARQKILAYWKRLADEQDRPEITVGNANSLLAVTWNGAPFDEPWEEFLRVLRDPAVAAVLASLRLTGPDEGANGTRNWDLEPLFEEDPAVSFPRLRAVFIEGASPGDHNRSIVGSVYEEAGILARLLGAAPALEELEVPSAPSSAFFDRPRHPLERLAVAAGYDPQGFVANLTTAACFDRLESLAYTDFEEVNLEDYAAMRTSVEEWARFFDAARLPGLRHLTIRSSVLRPADVAALRRTPLGRGLDRLEIARGISLDWAAGDHVLARPWGDRRWQPATVLGPGEDRGSFHVNFLAGREERAVPAFYVREDDR